MAASAAILKRDFDQAIDMLSEALNLDPENVIFMNGLATALMLAERVEEAIAEWEKILEQNPDPSVAEGVRQNLKRARGD